MTGWRSTSPEELTTLERMQRMWDDYALLEETLWTDPDDQPAEVRAAHEEFTAVRKTLPLRLQVAWWLSGGGW